MRTMIVVGALLLVGCGDDGGGARPDTLLADTPASGHTVDGTVVEMGGTAPATGEAIVLWVSDIGQGDFVYKWGQGTATATTFNVDVVTPVPNDATFGGMVGVGTVALVPSGTSVPDGVVPDSTFNTALGYTGEYAIIYRPSASSAPASWVDAFPVGLACGKCVHQTSGLDTFMPVACSTVVLGVGPQSMTYTCNWT
ncbi:MAG TPA: hypothetical protein VL326_17485 [Kofleriaceae bacterium]|jgi:hypothetical protein|nr:hypothetical protein [Kofleriaceae bacterium]